MTVNEFNDKYKDYLEEGHYGLDIDNLYVIDLLDKVFTGWIEDSKDFRYSQIKLKFGMARVYVEGIDRDTISTIENAIDILMKDEKKEEIVNRESSECNS